MDLENFLNFFGSNLYYRVFAVVFLITLTYLTYRWIANPTFVVLRGLWTFWQTRRQSTVILEITPPKYSEKTATTTQQLFSIIQQIIGNRPVALEIDAMKEHGIRYLIRARRDQVQALQKQIASYLPDARFEVHETEPVTESAANRISAFEVRQSRRYVFPLKPQEELSQGDPVGYIAGSMAKLQQDERIVLQLVVAPHYSYWTTRLYNKILRHGQAVVDHRLRYFLLSRWWVWVICLLYGIFTNNIWGMLALAMVLAAISLFIPKQKQELTPNEQTIYAGILDKLGQPLFRADMRLYVSAGNPERIGSLASGVASSLAPYNTPGMQQLYFKQHRFVHKFDVFKMLHRLPSLFVFNSTILSLSELASIYHFPYGTIKTEGMVRSHSKTLPATLAMKNNNFDVVIGQNSHHGEITPIGLTAAERERHIFIIGGTGNGKTTMLQYAIVQDIQNGKGVAVVDPHGDMAETLLSYIPDERIDDVIYFNPDDLAHPIGLNLLELAPGLEGDELLREKDLVTESVVSVFRKIFSDDDSGGHRIEYVLRNTIQTALTTENPTLFTMFDLLNDPAYRKKIIAKLDNKDLVNFWKNELGKAGGFQQVKMVAGITSKIGRFLFSASAKRILEQPKSTINFDEILDGKILICNFSKGLLGEDTSELFGIAILAKLQLASLRRARLEQADRKPFYLYVDEFQNFATPSFVQMLSEARKYKLYLTMAEQSTSQQDDQQMVNIILANVGTVICFRSGNPADEKLILPLFEPYIEKGEIANLPSYSFYMRVSAQKSQEPLSGETVLLEDGNQNINAVIQASRQYTRRSLKRPDKTNRTTMQKKQTTKKKTKLLGN